MDDESGRRGLSDDQWAPVLELQSPMALLERRPLDQQLILNVILHVLTTACRWSDLRSEFGT